ncbi:MAG: hypothetical protein LLF94_05500, partial [Chlamydiales bacterium]|nr:hypothetical protein [Chlamydiales bacterium]
LDVESMEAFMDALEEFEGAVVIVSHSELVLERLATKLVVFRNGIQEQFLGTYEEFIEKGGWDEEEKQSVKKEQTNKDSKRQRAELVNERSRALKPHTTKADQLELRIIKLEEEVEVSNQKLLEAVEKNHASTIVELSKTLKDKQREIETLFTSLEEVSQVIESIKQDFESKFDLVS